MELYKKLLQAISERELSSILKVYPPNAFTPYDPSRTSNHRLVRLDKLKYTTLYIFVDGNNSLKAYSSLDMKVISKDAVLAYISNDVSLERLKTTLERHVYSSIEWPKDTFCVQEIDITAQILDIEYFNEEREEQLNVLKTAYGETLPMSMDKKVVNFAFLDPIANAYSYFNHKAGLHHTMRLADARDIVVHFNPLLTLQNHPEEHGYITVMNGDKPMHRYLYSVLISLNKPIIYNLHSVDDYYFFTKYLLECNQEGQINEKLQLISVEKNQLDTTFLISFKTDINNIKKRGVGVKLNEIFLQWYSHNKGTNDIDEKSFNFSKNIKDKFFNLNIELVGGLLHVKGSNSIGLYHQFIELFFGKQPIESVSNPVE